MRQDELYHFGVKGMRWGHRKPKDKTGSSDKKRLSDEQKAKLKKIALGAAGVAAAGIAAKAIHDNYADKVIKNASLHKIQLGPTSSLVGQYGRSLRGQKNDLEAYPGMYATYKKRDSKRYMGRHAKNTLNINLFNDGGMHSVHYKTNGDLHVASPHKAKKVFMDLYKKDPSFRAQADSMISDSRGFVAPKQILTKALGKRTNFGKYSAFNMSMIGNSEAKTKYFDALKKQGVNAIHDLNDRRLSGYGTKSAVIYFGDASKVGSKRLSDRTINSHVATDYIRDIARGSTTGIAASMLLQNRRKNLSKKDAIQVYKKQHPKTKLSDEQILRRAAMEDKVFEHGDSERNELYHFGVKGMHWGERRARRKAKKRLKKEMNKSSYRYFKKKQRRNKWLKRAVIVGGMYALAKSPATRALAVEGVKSAGKSAADMYKKVKSLKHSDDELYHFGIKGMRWGHRKPQVYYRQPDGSFQKYTRSQQFVDSRAARSFAAMDRRKNKRINRYMAKGMNRRDATNKATKIQNRIGYAQTAALLGGALGATIWADNRLH